jgi:hypothetical protein
MICFVLSFNGFFQTIGAREAEADDDGSTSEATAVVDTAFCCCHASG